MLSGKASLAGDEYDLLHRDLHSPAMKIADCTRGRERVAVSSPRRFSSALGFVQRLKHWKDT